MKAFQNSENKDALHLLLECGVLVSQNNQEEDPCPNLTSEYLVFVSVLAQRYFMHMIYGYRAAQNPNSVLDLMKCTIPLIPSSILKQSVANANDYTFQRSYFSTCVYGRFGC